MASGYGKFKPLFQYDNSQPEGLCLWEPPFSVPTASAFGADWLEHWLVETGYGRYRPCFRKRGITGMSLLDLNEADLKSLGITDMGDVRGIMGNIDALRHSQRHMQPEELPGLSYMHYRALNFGLQPTLDRWLWSSSNPGRDVTGPLHHTDPCLADTRTLHRIRSMGGDPAGWFRRNMPHPLN